MTDPQKRRLGLMRWASLAEATTLILLVAVAMPLKYWAGMPQAVQIIGPVHGAAFVAYVLVLGWAVSAGGWKPLQVLAAVVAAFVPVAGFVNERWIAARYAAA